MPALTPEQVESLAQQVMQDYVQACGCANVQDVGNVLMKLASICGLGMCATVGQEEAVDRLQGTTDYIAKVQAGVNWKMERAQ
jgi:hypothetical protein